MLSRIARAHQVSAYVLGTVAFLSLLLASSLLLGVGMFAVGQPRLLISLVAAFAIVGPFLSLPIRLLGAARTFDDRQARLTALRRAGAAIG